MEGKWLLVVGAGRGQLPAILAAKRMGLRVAAVDRNPEAIGLPVADSGRVIDVKDIEAVVDFARSISVGGAMTLQSDLPVETVAAVCDALDLSGVSPRVAHWCSNKIAMRKRLASASVAQPGFRIAHSEMEVHAAIAEIGLPAVIKSPESSGSRGVSVITSSAEVRDSMKYALAVSPSGAVLVEEFIVGTEVGAQTLSLNGHCEIVVVHEDQLAGPSRVVPVGHSYPAGLDSFNRSRVEQIVSSAVEALGIAHGPANVDLIIDGRGEPYILEIGARIGATCLPELTSFHVGFEWVETAVACAMGETPAIPEVQCRPVAAKVLTAPRSGLLKSFHLADETLLDGILEWEMEVGPDSWVKEFRTGPDRIGRVMATGSDARDARMNVERFVAGVILDIEDGAESEASSGVDRRA